jgi:hypothetical protein
MSVRATFQFPAAAHEPAVTRAELVDRAVSALGQRGFRVLSVGRFGISVEASSTDFCRALGVEASCEVGQTLDLNACDAPLSEWFSKVDIAPELQYYSSN